MGKRKGFINQTSNTCESESDVERFVLERNQISKVTKNFKRQQGGTPYTNITGQVMYACIVHSCTTQCNIRKYFSIQYSLLTLKLVTWRDIPDAYEVSPRGKGKREKENNTGVQFRDITLPKARTLQMYYHISKSYLVNILSPSAFLDGTETTCVQKYFPSHVQ